jgi:hypothetical protein
MTRDDESVRAGLARLAERPEFTAIPAADIEAWHRRATRRTRVLAVVSVVIVVALIAVAASRLHAISASSPVPAHRPPVTQGNHAGPVGTTFVVPDRNGNTMEATLLKVIDPAPPANDSGFGGPDHGDRLVAATFRLTGLSGRVGGDANRDAALIDRDHLPYSAWGVAKGCPNFNNGWFSIRPGRQVVGCVVFDIPKRIKVAQVQWDPSGGYRRTPQATWNLSSPSATSQNNNSGPVGTTFVVPDRNGNRLKVTLLKVIDPAQRTPNDLNPGPAIRMVAAKFRLTGLSGQVSGDANGDATLIGRDHVEYGADSSQAAVGCTSFTNRLLTLRPGQRLIGCVVYQVPTPVTVARIRYDLSGGWGDTPQVTWYL